MLSPRYHLVSIVAIFLALGLGLLAGSSFGQPALVGQLQERTEAQLRRIDELRGQVDEARARADALAAYASASAPHLVAGRLEGFRAVVVTQEGVPTALEASVLAALEASGARVLATLAAQPAIADPTPEVALALSALVGPSDADAEASVAAGTALARRLGTAIAPIDPEVDLLARLLNAGFLAARDGAIDDTTRLEIHAMQFLVVVLGGTDTEETVLPTRSFAAALVRGLANAAIPVAAVEIVGAGDPWIAELPTDAIVTVVGAEEPVGAAALVLGLAEIARTGDGGAYGGDRAPLPSFP